MRLLNAFVVSVCVYVLRTWAQLHLSSATFWQDLVPFRSLFQRDDGDASGKNAIVVWSEFRCRSQLQLQWLYGNVHGVRQRHIEYLCYGFLCSIYSLAFFVRVVCTRRASVFRHEDVKLSHMTTPLAAKHASDTYFRSNGHVGRTFKRTRSEAACQKYGIGLLSIVASVVRQINACTRACGGEIEQNSSSESKRSRDAVRNNATLQWIWSSRKWIPW